MSNRDLTTETGWIGVWLRGRGGPTTHSQTGAVTVDRWHRVAGINRRYGDVRFSAACGRRGSEQLSPSGGHRIEVADGSWTEPPGPICSYCQIAPLRPRPSRAGTALGEPEVWVDNEALDEIATRVTQRIIERADEFRTNERDSGGEQ